MCLFYFLKNYLINQLFLFQNAKNIYSINMFPSVNKITMNGFDANR